MSTQMGQSEPGWDSDIGKGPSGWDVARHRGLE